MSLVKQLKSDGNDCRTCRAVIGFLSAPLLLIIGAGTVIAL